MVSFFVNVFEYMYTVQYNFFWNWKKWEGKDKHYTFDVSERCTFCFRQILTGQTKTIINICTCGFFISTSWHLKESNKDWIAKKNKKIGPIKVALLGGRVGIQLLSYALFK